MANSETSEPDGSTPCTEETGSQTTARQPRAKSRAWRIVLLLLLAGTIGAVAVMIVRAVRDEQPPPIAAFLSVGPPDHMILGLPPTMYAQEIIDRIASAHAESNFLSVKHNGCLGSRVSPAALRARTTRVLALNVTYQHKM